MANDERHETAESLTRSVADELDLSWFLHHRHAEIPLFVLRLEPTVTHPSPGTPEHDTLLREHFLYWLKLETEGVLLAAGPVDDGTGLAVVRVSDRAAAERLAADEPFTRCGHRRATVSKWNLNEGSLVSHARSAWQPDGAEADMAEPG